MVFSSLPFLFGFLVAVLLVYYSLPKKCRNFCLFFFSILFYGFGEPVYVLLMLFSITVNFAIGLLLHRFREKRRPKKWILMLAVVINLGLLGYFKYAGFAAELLGKISIHISVPAIALPIGISFYTFQILSYIIDVYRGNCPAQKNFIQFGTYVTLFPQLIAGPIVRYVDVAYQLEHRRESWPLFNRGVTLFLVGLAKKVLLANPMGILWNSIKTDPASGILGSWVGIIAFTLQIYFDFSGYSDMACGLGNCFGFSFVKNFDYPYCSKSITEFWRRWHISLSTWFREYVYIPLGGNRKGKIRQILNLIVTWLLTGLWHGASTNFVLWGAYFCMLLIVEKFLLSTLLKKLPAIVRHIYALFFIILGWVIFDFTDMAQMGQFFWRLFTWQNGLLGAATKYMVLSFLPLLAIAAFGCFPIVKHLYQKIENQPIGIAVQSLGAVLILVLSVASLVHSGYNPFLYFRF